MDVERRQGVKPTPVLTLLPISGVVNRLDTSLMGRSGYYARPGKRAEAVTCPGLRLSFDCQGHILPLQPKGDVKKIKGAQGGWRSRRIGRGGWMKGLITTYPLLLHDHARLLARMGSRHP